MAESYTSRNGKKIDFDGVHLNLDQLREKNITNNYLYRDIPPYPQPEFSVSYLKHDTSREGLEGILADSGFKGLGQGSLMWFSLAVGPEEIRSAEKKLLRETFPDLQNEGDGNSFLWKFATTPAFSETSTYGSFRLTLPLQEVLDAYRQQICPDNEAIMRVYKTSVFSQEVQYIVLVHGKKHNRRFDEFPLLENQPDESICWYMDGEIVWKSQAMCGTHNYYMEAVGEQIHAVPVDDRPQNLRWYVWDQVSVAFYLEEDEVLELSEDQLKRSLTHCEMFPAPYMEKRKKAFVNFEKAERFLTERWPTFRLRKETSLQDHFEEPVGQDAHDG